MMYRKSVITKLVTSFKAAEVEEVEDNKSYPRLDAP